MMKRGRLAHSDQGPVGSAYILQRSGTWRPRSEKVEFDAKPCPRSLSFFFLISLGRMEINVLVD